MIIIGLLQIFLVYSLGYVVRHFVVLIKYCLFLFIHFNPYSARFSLHALLACIVLGLVHVRVTTTGHLLFSLKSTPASFEASGYKSTSMWNSYNAHVLFKYRVKPCPCWRKNTGNCCCADQECTHTCSEVQEEAVWLDTWVKMKGEKNKVNLMVRIYYKLPNRRSRWMRLFLCSYVMHWNSRVVVDGFN